MEMPTDPTLSSSVTGAGESAGGASDASIQLQLIIDTLTLKVTRMMELFQQIAQYDKHIHNAHHHLEYSHWDQMNFDGGRFVSEDATDAQILTKEYTNSWDYDMNKRLYGTDFIIDPNDEDRPLQIKQLEHMPDYPWHLSKMTWKQYLASVPNCRKDYNNLSKPSPNRPVAAVKATQVEAYKGKRIIQKGKKVAASKIVKKKTTPKSKKKR